MKTINKILMTALCSTAMTTPAFAQDAAQEVESFDDNVIIVTATRRAEDVQDIPIAVTAVSPAQLEQQGVVNVQNIGSVSSSFSTSNAQTLPPTRKRLPERLFFVFAVSVRLPTTSALNQPSVSS